MVAEAVDHEEVIIASAEGVVIRRVQSPIFDVDGQLVPGWSCMWITVPDDEPMICPSCRRPVDNEEPQLEILPVPI